MTNSTDIHDLPITILMMLLLNLPIRTGRALTLENQRLNTMLRITKTFSFLFLASMMTVATVNAQSPCATSNCGGCAQSDACGGECTANLSDCGRSGALFKRGQQCGACGDCGGGDCGAAACGGGNVGGSGQIMDRVKNWILPPKGCGDRYRSVFGGWSDLSDYTGDVVAGPVGGTFKDGFILGTARGRYLNDNTRIELDTTWRNNSGENWDSPLGTGQLDGHFNSVSSLVNVVREFGNGRVKPYAGAGVGWTIQDGDFDAMGNHFRLDDWRLAYQGILGFNFMQANNTDLYCEYRYLGNTDAGIEDSFGNRFDEFAYLSESVVFGFRIKR